MNTTANEIEGEGLKVFIPSIFNNIWTRLKLLLGLKLPGHTDTLTEASNLQDKIYQRGETKIDNKIEMLSINFLANKWIP